MTLVHKKSTALVLGLTLALAGCAAQAPSGETDGPRGFRDGKGDSSVEATFLDFEFDGEMVTDGEWNIERRIEEQFLYTVGQLNGDNSVGRLDNVQLTDLTTTPLEDGTYRVTYHAKMLVAWGKRDQVPETYDLLLPRSASPSGLQAFTEKYSHSCVDWSAHDVDVNSMWYYYRPRYCSLDEADIVRLTATVTPSAIETSGKYPEYHEVWKDMTLRVVAVFGKYEHGATSNNDPGISSFNQFTRMVRDELATNPVTTIPADLSSTPGVDNPDVTISAELPDGRRVEVVTLLVDSVRTADYAFYARYEDLSERADFIAYTGHSGLGANIRTLAQRGRWVAEQYVIVMMNGCDTYAYVDGALARAHMDVNDDDPNGTKYLDLIMNAMPSPSARGAESPIAIVRGLLDYDAPRTYESMLAEIGSRQVVLVSGEQDNVYHPGMDGGGGGTEDWAGLDDSGTVARDEEKRFETDSLPAGRYLFRMTGTGDADLYTRIGQPPAVDLFDCRPYSSSSDEACEVELTSPASIHVMVRGYAASSDYHLVGQSAP